MPIVNSPSPMSAAGGASSTSFSSPRARPRCFTASSVTYSSISRLRSTLAVWNSIHRRSIAFPCNGLSLRKRSGSNSHQLIDALAPLLLLECDLVNFAILARERLLVGPRGTFFRALLTMKLYLLVFECMTLLARVHVVRCAFVRWRDLQEFVRDRCFVGFDAFEVALLDRFAHLDFFADHRVLQFEHCGLLAV